MARFHRETKKKKQFEFCRDRQTDGETEIQTESTTKTNRLSLGAESITLNSIHPGRPK